MSFLKNAITTVKKIPVKVWLAAVVVPGGLIALGTYIVVKGVKNEERKQEDSNKPDGL